MTKRLIAAALLAACLPALTACFPLVATGVGTGALMVADRRTSGSFVDDQAIEVKAENAIGKKLGDRNHVNVTSFNRVALLTGEVLSEDAKAEAERIARATENVKDVMNELVVSGQSSITARSNDAFITTKVKSRFVEANKFYANHVKVVTEAGTVFLMGMVTQAEAEAATNLARTTSGVARVVKLFEYIGQDTAKQLDARPPEQAPAAAQ